MLAIFRSKLGISGACDRVISALNVNWKNRMISFWGPTYQESDKIISAF